MLARGYSRTGHTKILQLRLGDFLCKLVGQGAPEISWVRRLRFSFWILERPAGGQRGMGGRFDAPSLVSSTGRASVSLPLALSQFSLRAYMPLRKLERCSGLRCPAFAAGGAAPLQKTDRCPNSASAVSAAGSASAALPASARLFRPQDATECGCPRWGVLFTAVLACTAIKHPRPRMRARIEKLFARLFLEKAETPRYCRWGRGKAGGVSM